MFRTIIRGVYEWILNPKSRGSQIGIYRHTAQHVIRVDRRGTRTRPKAFAPKGGEGEGKGQQQRRVGFEESEVKAHENQRRAAEGGR